MQNWKELIFSEDIAFEDKASKVFEYQYKNNIMYKRYCNALHSVIGNTYSKLEAKETALSPSKIGDKLMGLAREDVDNIPLFPIQGFKDAELTCRTDTEPELVFKSSGTTSMARSTHLVADAGIYRESLIRGFNHFYGSDSTTILAYTPGYSENPDSSLIWMLQELITKSDSTVSRFLPLNEPLKQNDIDDIASEGSRIILFGAAFGLVDLVESSDVVLPGNSLVIETGGMKTHKREMSRNEMHKNLAKGFGTAEDRIHSEYGMAELLSQAYARGGKWFHTVPWMKVTVRDADDPRQKMPPYQEGLIGVIDLANVHSCSFLLTGDKGIMDNGGRFQVLGRWNQKDLRGCNFLIDED
ncbi:hypothetical protein G3570_05790 [Balneolaceae bacterium YR4-1]|uniref:Acyl-protein synthetase LuxE domain-containing protein n=1 Tax=Halalkalibaculum roseum TaxID=2709311 RepID=A0A6M1T798_9BACT|nr:hypothetical protein [Halalkalibaculum roseum]NGP76133.1 hypothetical protein [Halalkalibaculum roseum]